MSGALRFEPVPEVVPLSRLQVVAQEFRHPVHIGAGVEQPRGKGVWELVRG